MKIMPRILGLVVLLFVLCGCYESTVEVVRPDEASAISGIKNFRFEGRMVKTDGTMAADPDMVYLIVSKEKPNDYIYVNPADNLAGVRRRVRFLMLDNNLFLGQSSPAEDVAVKRYQLFLCRMTADGRAIEVVTPDERNTQGVDVKASVTHFAKELGLQMTPSGQGSNRLKGEPQKIERFMHSLSTLPLRVVYRFQDAPAP